MPSLRDRFEDSACDPAALAQLADGLYDDADFEADLRNAIYEVLTDYTADHGVEIDAEAADEFEAELAEKGISGLALLRDDLLAGGTDARSGRSRPSLPVDDLHELAHIERLLRKDTRAHKPAVSVCRSGARIRWDTWAFNGHARGSLLASVVLELAATDSWGVATIHDPLERRDQVSSMLTVVYDPDEQGAETDA